MVLLIAVVIFILSAIAMMAIPVKVLEFKDVKYPVLTPVVKAGGMLEYKAHVVKYKNLEGLVTRQLINSYIYNYTPVTGQLPCGESDRNIQIELPTYIEPGIYYIRIVYSYRVNIFRTEKYIQDTETFTVIQ
jgi:hypothetical protein